MAFIYLDLEDNDSHLLDSISKYLPATDLTQLKLSLTKSIYGINKLLFQKGKNNNIIIDYIKKLPLHVFDHIIYSHLLNNTLDIPNNIKYEILIDYNIILTNILEKIKTNYFSIDIIKEHIEYCFKSKDNETKSKLIKYLQELKEFPIKNTRLFNLIATYNLFYYTKDIPDLFIEKFKNAMNLENFNIDYSWETYYGVINRYYRIFEDVLDKNFHNILKDKYNLVNFDLFQKYGIETKLDLDNLHFDEHIISHQIENFSTIQLEKIFLYYYNCRYRLTQTYNLS